MSALSSDISALSRTARKNGQCARMSWKQSSGERASPAPSPYHPGRLKRPRIQEKTHAMPRTSLRLRAPGRPAAARHGAAAPVEERESDPVLVAYARDRFLRPIECPVGGHVAAILVAVGVADHDHLLPTASRDVLTVDAKRKELRQDPGSGVEILEGLEERHDPEA